MAHLFGLGRDARMTVRARKLPTLSTADPLALPATASAADPAAARLALSPDDAATGAPPSAADLAAAAAPPPDGTPADEWVAARLLDFLDAAALLHAALACQYCTPSTCPTMHAGPRAEYRWPADPDAGVVPPTPGGGGGGGGRAAAQPPPSSSSAAAAAAAAAIAPSSAKARRLSAPAYVAALLDWADGLLANPHAFPQAPGTPFPPAFYPAARALARRTLRVFGHAYHAHFRAVAGPLGAGPHLNAIFRDAVAFCGAHGLLCAGDLDPLAELVGALLPAEVAAGLVGAGGARVASLVMVVARKPAGKGGKGKAPAARKGGANRKSIRTRAAADGTAAAPPAPAAPAPSVGQLTSHIANKQARGAMYAKLKHKAATEKASARRARQAADADAVAAGLPVVPRSHRQRTIESAREADPTVPGAGGDDDADAAAAHDEFAAYFAGDRPPAVMLTTTASPKKRTFALLADILEVLPAATYYRRGGASMARLAGAAARKGCTHLLVLNEGARGADSLLVAHLPSGPTARFRLTSVRLASTIPGHGRGVAGTSPELVLAGFTTRLGGRVGRLLASLFPPAPAFRARQVATFHAQRDFIFFRHHRYIFEADAKKAARQAGVRAAAVTAAGGDGGAAAGGLPPGVCARLQELGPRFTLRLSALYKGLLAGPGAETEWVAMRSAKGAGANRRRFVL